MNEEIGGYSKFESAAEIRNFLNNYPSLRELSPRAPFWFYTNTQGGIITIDKSCQRILLNIDELFDEEFKKSLKNKLIQMENN